MSSCAELPSAKRTATQSKDPYKSPQGWREDRAASTPWMLASRTTHSAQEDRPTNSYHSQYNPQTAITISKQWREQPCPRHPFKLIARSQKLTSYFFSSTSTYSASITPSSFFA